MTYNELDLKKIEVGGRLGLFWVSVGSRDWIREHIHAIKRERFLEEMSDL